MGLWDSTLSIIINMKYRPRDQPIAINLVTMNGEYSSIANVWTLVEEKEKEEAKGPLGRLCSQIPAIMPTLNTKIANSLDPTLASTLIASTCKNMFGSYCQ